MKILALKIVSYLTISAYEAMQMNVMEFLKRLNEITPKKIFLKCINHSRIIYDQNLMVVIPTCFRETDKTGNIQQVQYIPLVHSLLRIHPSVLAPGKCHFEMQTSKSDINTEITQESVSI